MKKNSKYDLFIFDFDGTLADSRLNIINSLNFALNTQGLSPIEGKRITPLIGKMSLDNTFLYFYPELKTVQIEKLLEEFRIYQREHAHEELVFFPEVLSTLEKLYKQKKMLAILTTKHISQITYILKLFKIDHFFDVVLGEGVISQRKPASECVGYILSSLSVPLDKSKVVMIGDSSVDVLSAQNGGIDMIAVGHGTDSLESLKEMGAIFTVNTFSEILQYT